MGQKDKCEVRLLACRIFLNSGYTLVEARYWQLMLNILFICVSYTHTQLAAYLNFFEIVELLNLKKKTLTTEKHVGH